MKNDDLRSASGKLGRRDFLKTSTGAAIASTLLAASGKAQKAGGQTLSIDMHTHWAPESYTKALQELGKASQGNNPLNFDLDKRRKWMDEHGIQVHVLTLSGGMPWWWASADVGAHLAQLVNDAAVEAHTAFPDRFLAGIELPVQDPTLALKELNRVAGKAGLRAVHIPNSMNGRDYVFEPAFFPVLARTEELGLPLLFHPLDGDANIYGGKERLGGEWEKANLNNTLGFPFEHATTAAKFIVSGILDKLPRLEIVLPHSGGAFPYITGRIERGLASKNFKLQRPFREYIRRFHYDSLTYYPEIMRFLISLVGSDRIVIGTDNYAPMDVPKPNALVEALNLPQRDLERILRGNAARLLRL